MKSIFCLLFGIFLVFALSYVPSVTLAQTDEHAQPPAQQMQEGTGVETQPRHQTTTALLTSLSTRHHPKTM